MLYDQGNGNWVTLAESVTEKTYTATGLTNDVVYAFKVQSQNMIDYSDESAELSIRAAAVPTAPNEPQTYVNGNNVDVEWDAPYNGGSVITAYKVVIKLSDGITW